MKKRFCAVDVDSEEKFLKEAKLMISLQRNNVVQLKALCLLLCRSLSISTFSVLPMKPVFKSWLNSYVRSTKGYNCEGFTRVMPHIVDGVVRGLQYLHGKGIDIPPSRDSPFMTHVINKAAHELGLMRTEEVGKKDHTLIGKLLAA